MASKFQVNTRKKITKREKGEDSCLLRSEVQGQEVVEQERQLCDYFIVFLKLLDWMLKHFIRLFNISEFCCSHCLGFRVPPHDINSFLSVQFSRSVVSDSLHTHELQHARPPCASPTPGVHPNSYPSSRWCYPAISSSVVPFSSCPSPSQHQSLFQWANSLHEVAKVLEFQL